MNKNHFLLLTLFLTMTMSSCVVITDEEPQETNLEYTLKLSVDRIIVNLTCEGTNGDEQEADLYTKLIISEGVSYPPTIAEQDYTLVQLGLGEQSTNTGLAVEVDVEFDDMTQFNAHIDTYENDPGGVRDISKLFGKSIQFDAAAECWRFNGDCLNGSESFPHEFKLTLYNRMSDNRCDIEYHWTFELVAS